MGSKKNYIYYNVDYFVDIDMVVLLIIFYYLGLVFVRDFYEHLIDLSIHDDVVHKIDVIVDIKKII